MTSKRLSTRCPYCAGAMRPVAMACDACSSEIRGDFRESVFLRLAENDLEFLEEYLFCDFSIKALAERTGLGYTAIRSRLDRILSQCRDLRSREGEKRRVLERLAAGEITADMAELLISRLVN